MKWTQSADELYWHRECGRYYVCRSLAFDENPDGKWIYLAFFKRAAGEPGEAISPKRRSTFETAVKDCTAHMAPKEEA
jgi:hypothetical protein